MSAFSCKLACQYFSFLVFGIAVDFRNLAVELIEYSFPIQVDDLSIEILEVMDSVFMQFADECGQDFILREYYIEQAVCKITKYKRLDIVFFNASFFNGFYED